MSDDAGPEQPAADRNDEDDSRSDEDDSGHEGNPGPTSGADPAVNAVGARVFRVDVTGARGVLVGDNSAQHNYFQFFAGTWTDGVAPQPLAATSGQVESPYRGLEAFRETDADFFFGREAAIGEVLSRLSDCLAGTGLLVVSGVSGAGKTSLLRAGVLRELRRAGLPSEPAAARWPCVVLVPGGSPLDELALAISSVTGADAAGVRQSLAANPADFALTARQAAQFSGPADAGPADADSQRLLLVVDQFETVFTQCDRDEERTAFIAALCAAGRAGAAVVVIVIRADLEARLADHPELADAVQDRYLLGAMTERQLRLAITEPAGTVNSAVDDDLVAELLREVRAQADRPGGGSRTVGAGVLPLLSHALDQAWRGRPPAFGGGNAPLTLADYERTGGIDRAVADSAQAAYASLTAGQQAVAQQVFTRLTATTADGIDTAVRATRAELLADRDGPAAADVEAVLTAFATRRLLTLAADTVEISHEILLSAWPLLRDDWLAATRADRAARARLQSTVTEWLASGLDRSFLYSGSQLDATARAADRIAADGRQTSLTRDERAFLAAGRRAAERAARIRRAAVVGITVLAAGLAVALVIATTSRDEALRSGQLARAAEQSAVQARNRTEAELARQTSSQLASATLPLLNTDPRTAAMDSVLAWTLNPQSQQARYALQSSAADPLIAVFRDSSTPEVDADPESVAFSPDGKTLAVSGTGADQAGAQLWNLVTGSESTARFTVGSTASSLNFGTPVAFSPDGKSLIVAAGQQVARWDIATGREAAALSPSNLGILTSMALSPDGNTLAVSSLPCDCVQLLNPATGRQIGAALSPVGRRGLADATGDVLLSFSPDGKTLITAGPDGAVRLWNVATHQLEGPAFPALASTIDSLAVSPDGTILATGQADGTVRIWDVTTGRQIGQPLIAGTGTDAKVETMAFSPDGSMIAVGDDNSTVRIWSVPTRQQVGPALSGGLEMVNAVAFSPHGQELASADDDGSVRLWSLAALAGAQAAPPLPAGEGISANGYGAVALGPDQKLVTSNNASQVTIWQPAANAENGYASATVPDPSTSTQVAEGVSGGGVNLALSPDGKTLATGADDGSVWLWNLPVGLTSLTPARTIPPPESVSTAPAPQDLAFSPNGSRIAVYYAAGTAAVFDTATGRLVTASTATVNLPGGVLALGFAQGGASVLIVCTNGDVISWDLATGVTSISQFAPLSDLNSSLPPTVALSPDGTTIAFSTSDTVQLWGLEPGQQSGVQTGQQIGTSIDPGDGLVFMLAFSPDGKTLATGANDGVVRLWNVGYLTPGGALAELCARIRPTMSALDWAAKLAAQAGRSYQQACAASR